MLMCQQKSANVSKFQIIKKVGVQPIGRTEKLYSRFVWQKVFEIELFLRVPVSILTHEKS